MHPSVPGPAITWPIHVDLTKLLLETDRGRFPRTGAHLSRFRTYGICSHSALFSAQVTFIG